MEMFLENSCTFYDRQIILLNVGVKKSYAQNAQAAVNHRDFGKAKQIKSTQVYDKSQQKKKQIAAF